MTTAALPWPFFAASHVELAREARAWVRQNVRGHEDESQTATDAACREWVAALGRAGLTKHCVPQAYGGTCADFDARAICLLREILAEHDGLADFAFAMQGLGSGAISIAGSETLREHWLPRVAAGRAIAAFALSEPDAGSDVAAMRCAAVREGDHYVLDGIKTWISNGGIADFYCVFARTTPLQRRPDGSALAQGISAFVVPADTQGITIENRIDVIAPHPLATLRFSNCRIGVEQRLGAEGAGFKIAMRTLDTFRTSVAAAAVGFARRALREALGHGNRNRCRSPARLPRCMDARPREDRHQGSRDGEDECD